MDRRIIFALLLSVTLFTGCDAFRRIAGRPTSEELAQMKVEMMQEKEAAHQARVDSLRQLEQSLSDSLAVLDSIKQAAGTVLNPSKMGGMFITKLDSRYYVVVGAFRSRANAEKLLNRVSKKGYSPIIINFRNGFNAVAVLPTNALPDALAALRKVKAESFCPDDVWILVND